MNYSALIKGLSKDILSFVAFKKLSVVARVLAVLLLLPFICATITGVVTLWVMLFFFKGYTAAVEYLEAWLKETKKDTKGATEAIIYLVCLPVIFLFRVMFSVFAISFFFNWFYTECVAYVGTLGGIKWQPFISDAEFDDKEYTSNIDTASAEKNIIKTICLMLITPVALAILGAIIGVLVEAVGVVAAVFFALGAMVGGIAYLVLLLKIVIFYRKVEVVAPVEEPAVVEEPVEA